MQKLSPNGLIFVNLCVNFFKDFSLANRLRGMNTNKNTALEDMRCLKLFLHNILLVAIVQFFLHIGAYLINLAQNS